MKRSKWSPATTKTTRSTPTNDLATFLESLGLDNVVDYGEEVGARCLKHSERTGYEENNPRHWYINVRTTEHHCFSCGYKGNLRSLVVDLCGGDLWKASGLLQGFVDDQMFRPFEEEKKLSKRELPPEAVLMGFSWPSERPMQRRGISLETCIRFGIRWDDEDSSWIFPIRDPKYPHALWGWQAKRRNIVRNQPRRVLKSHTLFGIDVVENPDQLVVVESPLDAALLYENGFWGLASFGAEVTGEQMQLLEEMECLVILALDSDNAGVSSTRRLVEEWRRVFVQRLRVFNYSQAPDAKDIGDMTADEISYGIEEALRVPEWEKHVHRQTARFSGRGSGKDDRPKSLARRVSAGAGKNRDLDSGRRTFNRRR